MEESPDTHEAEDSTGSITADHITSHHITSHHITSHITSHHITRHGVARHGIRSHGVHTSKHMPWLRPARVFLPLRLMISNTMYTGGGVPVAVLRYGASDDVPGGVLAATCVASTLEHSSPSSTVTPPLYPHSCAYSVCCILRNTNLRSMRYAPLSSTYMQQR